MKVETSIAGPFGDDILCGSKLPDWEVGCQHKRQPKSWLSLACMFLLKHFVYITSTSISQNV